MQFRVDDSVPADVGADVWPVYESVFGDYSDYETWRASVWDTHRVRTGFRLARAYDADVLLGFAYRYTGERGQWWTDHALEVLEPGIADTWLEDTSSWSASACSALPGVEVSAEV